MNADGAGARLGGMTFRDERKGSRNIEGFADAHKGSNEEQFVKRGGVASPPRHGTPHKQAAGNDMAFAEAIGHPSAERGQQGIGPLEESEDEAPIGFVGDGGDVRRDGALHGAEHLPVEVVQEGDW